MPSIINDIGQELIDAAQYTVSSIFPAILILLLFVFSWWVVGKIFPTGVPDTWHIWLSVTAWGLRLCFIVLAFSLTLDALGLDANSIVATLIAFTFPSAWVFSEPLKNFIAAFFIRFSYTKESRIGNKIGFGSYEGIIKHKTLQKVTVARGDEGTISFPNVYFLTRPLEENTPDDYIEQKITGSSGRMNGMGGMFYEGGIDDERGRQRHRKKTEDDHYTFHAMYEDHIANHNHTNSNKNPKITL